jgi:hypothetical protein
VKYKASSNKNGIRQGYNKKDFPISVTFYLLFFRLSERNIKNKIVDNFLYVISKSIVKRVLRSYECGWVYKKDS